MLEAYAKLQQGLDAVLGSSEDGGYNLIGARRTDDTLFKEINWGGNKVSDITRKNLSALGWHRDELDTLWEVDTPEDVERLCNSGLFRNFQVESLISLIG